MYPDPTPAAMHPAAVLVHYRHRQLTIRCIDSLLRHCPDLKAIYVVDNSEDAAERPAVLARFDGQDRLHWLTQDANRGFGAGCNAGMREAVKNGADAVLLINNDAWVEDDIVARFAAASARYRHKAMLTGQIYAPDGSVWYAGGDYSLHTVRTRHHQLPLTRERRVPFVCGCLIWLPAALIEQLQGFDPDYFLYLEDLDLSLRAQQAGYALICLPEVQIQHTPSSSTGGRDSPLAVYYQNRNRWLLLRRHGRWHHWLTFVPFYLLGLLRRLSGAHRRPSLRAISDALRGKWGRRI